MRQLLSAFILIIFLVSYGSCASLSEEQKRDYGVLSSAVTFSSDKVIGEFGDIIPEDFNSKDKFLEIVKDKVPKDYYNELKKYDINVKPKGNYYLLLIYDLNTKSLILFDFSCTPELDGPVLLEPEKYDISNLDLYDTCKTAQQYK